MMPRPKKNLCLQELTDLLEKGKTWKEVSETLGISISTAKRRLLQSGQSRSVVILQDEHLDLITNQLGSEHPSWGRRMILGYVESKDLRVPAERIRQSMLRTQPQLVADREHRRLSRRVYNVPHALSLCHIDGNHKLIEWKFVIHGMIDGFSRFVPLLACNNNNRSITVYNLFKSCCKVYGMPDRVRSDHGGENARVADCMLYFKGSDSRCFLTGRSVHNQRIERFWVDVNRCTKLIKEEFHSIEEEGLLQRNDSLDIFALHYIYKSIIDKRLQDFVGAWNSHKHTGQGSKSPKDVFFESRSSREVPVLFPSQEDFETRFPQNDAHEVTVSVEIINPTLSPVKESAICMIREQVEAQRLEAKEGYIAVREVLKDL